MTAEYTITFVESFPSGMRTPTSVTIWPTDPNWNDFGFGFRAKALISAPAISTGGDPAAVETRTVSLFVVPWPLVKVWRFNTWLSQRIAGTGQTSLDVAAVRDQFFTILADEKQYRTVFALCGREPGQLAALFGPLRDMAYLRWRGQESATLRELLASEAAGKGLFRNEGPYQVWHQARSLFGHDISKSMEDARKPFSFSSRLPGFQESHVLKVNFGVQPPLIDRAHALIGRNGVGKSQLLRELVVEAGLRTDPNRQSPFIDNEALRGSATDLQAGDQLANRVLVMTWDVNHEFPRESRLDSAFQYFNFLMNEPRAASEGNDETQLQASETQTAMLLQLLRGNDDRQQYERLKSALRPALKVEKLAVFVRGANDGVPGQWTSLSILTVGNEGNVLSQLQRVDVHKPPLRIDEDGRHVPLSSGERSFLNFGIRCTARLTTGTLLVLDEPETHLHPNLIADFMRILAILLAETKSISLIATHSPFVVRELPGRCVHVLRVDDEFHPSIRHAYLRTLGASVDRLAVDIFGDAEAPQLNRDLASKIAKNFETIDEVKRAFGEDLSFELLSEIRELIEHPEQEDDADHA
jgi:predicted ATPase